MEVVLAAYHFSCDLFLKMGCDQQSLVCRLEKYVVFLGGGACWPPAKVQQWPAHFLAPAGLEIQRLHGLKGDHFGLLSVNPKYLCLLFQLTEWFMVRM